MKFPVQKSVQIRCYGTLNDFLPLSIRGKSFVYHYTGFPNIMDLLQRMGIPHVEVANVLVDNKFAQWNKRLEGVNRVAVYPEFMQFDGVSGSLIPEYPVKEKSFIADAHLGKLVRFLRMIGYDTLFNVDFSDSEIIKISNDKARVILTRDKCILFQGGSKWGYFIRSQDPKIQLQEVLSKFGLPTTSLPLSRCMVCNGKIERVTNFSALELVETRIREQYKSFYSCSNCGKLYWEGSHYQKMRKLIQKIEDRYK